MTDCLSHCLVLTTHKNVLNLFFDFKFCSEITIIILLFSLLGICVDTYSCHFRLEVFKTLHRNASAIWKTQA